MSTFPPYASRVILQTMSAFRVRHLLPYIAIGNRRKCLFSLEFLLSHRLPYRLPCFAGHTKYSSLEAGLLLSSIQAPRIRTKRQRLIQHIIRPDGHGMPCQHRLYIHFRSGLHGVLKSPSEILKTEKRGASAGPAEAYFQLVESGFLLSGDVKQEGAVERLQKLHDELTAASITARSSWTTLFTSLWKFATHEVFRNVVPRGIYLYGGVGTGKTMLMDLFFKEVPLDKKKRVHFHSFMLEIHARLHQLRGSCAGDPIAIVAEQICKEFSVLCLDEFEVTDIADALILLRVLGRSWRRGLVLVATSNSAPEGLYLDGLNRHLFIPFFGLLRKHCDVINLDNDGKEGKDYRRSLAQLKAYFYPLNDEADMNMDKIFLAITDGLPGQPASAEVMMGRTVRVPLASGRVARFSFADICGSPLGAADYLALVRQYRVVFVDRIPWLGDPSNEHLARRFVTFIDIVYENRIILFCSADVPLLFLFSSEPGAGQDPGEDSRVQFFEGKKDAEEGTTLVPQLSVAGIGGSSGRSTTMIGNMEWSATGRAGVSLADLTGRTFTKVASRRTLSRLLEMQSEGYLTRNTELGDKVVSFLKSQVSVLATRNFLKV